MELPLLQMKNPLGQEDIMGLGYLYYLHAACRIPQLVAVTLPGSVRGYNQANNKIGLDQITSASVVNDTAKFGAPPGARNAHLLDVDSTADVKLALKSQTANAANY